MYTRIYTKSSGKVSCRISELKEGMGVSKRREIKIGDSVDETFKGSCVVKVYQVYVDSSKTIMLLVKETMATELGKNSYFDEYEEIVAVSNHQKIKNVTISDILA